MNFEHLIEINDPANVLLEPLSRNQLWNGLVMRAENPELSVVGLDACVMLERRVDYLRRELRFGRLRINDEVFSIFAHWNAVRITSDDGIMVFVKFA